MDLESLTLEALLNLAEQYPAMAQVLVALPWVVDDITEVEQQAIQSFAVAATDVDGAAFGRIVLGLPWVADDAVPRGEVEGIQALLRLRAADAQTALVIRTYPWVVDDMTDAEQKALHSFAVLAEGDVATARLVADFSWIGDGISAFEQLAMGVLRNVIQADPATARLTVAFPWVADGVESDERWAILRLHDLAVLDPTLAQVAAAFPWVADGVTEVERWTLAELSQLAEQDLALAQRVTTFRWVVKDATEASWATIDTVTQLAEEDLALARRVGNLLWLSESLAIAEGALRALLVFASEDPELVDPWLDRIAADPSGQSTALLAALGWVRRIAGGLLYDDLLASAFIQSKTVVLPLAGQVNLWAVQTTPSPEGEDLTAMAEEALRILEDFMGAPFPVTDVVLVVPVIGGGKDHGIGGGAHWGKFIQVTRYPPQPINRGVIEHEVGHFYFGFGPPWLVEGGAEFVSDYTWARRTGRVYPTDRRDLAQQRVQRFCDSQGISTIQQLNERQIADPGYETICHYSIGSYFLLNLYEALGEEVLSAALRELYLQYQGEPRPVTGEAFSRYEEAVYQAFLRNTPSDLVDAFHEVYDRIHGGPRPD